MKSNRIFVILVLLAALGNVRSEDVANLVSVKMRGERVSEALLVFIKLTDHAVTIDPAVAAAPRFIDFTATNVSKSVALAAFEHELREQCAIVIERKSDTQWIATIDEEMVPRLSSPVTNYDFSANADQQKRLGAIRDEIAKRRAIRIQTTTTTSNGAASSPADESPKK